jgi:phenylacetate-CoA ligase
VNRFDPIAPLVRTTIAPLWAFWERTPYLRHYRRLLATQYESPETIRERQWQQVRAQVQHAYDTVPFWREHLNDIGLRPSDLRSFADYQAVPILTKQDIRAQGHFLISEPFRGAKLRRKTTSGSTGVSLEIFVDEGSMQFKRACTLRSDEWSGWHLGERIAMLWGNPEYLKRGWRGRLRNALLERGHYLDTLKMDEETVSRYAHSLVRTQPSLVFGHAHSVCLLARFVHANGIGCIRPRGIITTAMVLHSWQRKLIEEVFACKVSNRYGCEEVSLIACECEAHEGLHINSDGVYVELIRDGRPAKPGEPGSVVVTDLTNRAMPLLRYKVGDVAVASSRTCSCGRGLPLLEQVEGREADYVLTRRGELISGISLTENFAMLVPGIAQLQIVQDAVDRFLFRIVPGPDFGTASSERIRYLVHERFGPDVAYNCEFVDSIPQERSGKYRFCISRVPNPFTEVPAHAGVNRSVAVN